MAEISNDTFIITNQDGKEVTLMYLDSIYRQDKTYVAFIETKDPGPADEIDLHVFFVGTDEKSGEELLYPVEDDDECALIAEIFFYRLQMKFEVMDEYENKGEPIPDDEQSSTIVNFPSNMRPSDN